MLIGNYFFYLIIPIMEYANVVWGGLYNWKIYKLEKNVAVLATIAGAAPMIGFLGTVIGMIVAIHEIANSGGQIDIKMLSDGLYTAMTTTVAGLIVGIIAYIAYNHLIVRTNKVIYQMEANSLEFLDLLNEPI